MLCFNDNREKHAHAPILQRVSQYLFFLVFLWRHKVAALNLYRLTLLFHALNARKGSEIEEEGGGC